MHRNLRSLLELLRRENDLVEVSTEVDPQLELAEVHRRVIEREIPHVSQLMRASADEVLEHADVIVVGNKAEEFREVASRLRGDQTLIDLVRLFDTPPPAGKYEGICW